MAPPIKVGDVQSTHAKGLTKFETIAGDLAQEMAAGFGTGAAHINKILERQGKTLDVIGGLVKNPAMVLEKRDGTAGAVRDLRRRLRAWWIPCRKTRNRRILDKGADCKLAAGACLEDGQPCSNSTGMALPFLSHANMSSSS